MEIVGSSSDGFSGGRSFPGSAEDCPSACGRSLGLDGSGVSGAPGTVGRAALVPSLAVAGCTVMAGAFTVPACAGGRAADDNKQLHECSNFLKYCVLFPKD